MWNQHDAMVTDLDDQTSNDVTGAWPVDIPAVLDTELQNDNDIRNGLIFDDFENAPRNWLIPAICSAVFFFPTGIFAVRNAIKAKAALDDGMSAEWKVYVGRTRFFVFLSLLLGGLTYCLLAIIISMVKNS